MQELDGGGAAAMAQPRRGCQEPQAPIPLHCQPIEAIRGRRDEAIEPRTPLIYLPYSLFDPLFHDIELLKNLILV